MEDYIGLIIAAIIGITSLFAAQKKKQQEAGSKSGTLAEDDTIDIEALDAELSMAEGQSASKGQPSTMDILGKILTGDFSDLIPQPTPPPSVPVARAEYVDPIKARNKKSAERDALFEEDRVKEKARKKALTDNVSMVEQITAGNKAAIGEAIILGEIFNKPVSMRNKRNAMR